MEVVNIEKLINLKNEFAVAIGFFDGVHLGHQLVIKQAVNYAKTDDHIKSVVITFDRSPKAVLGYADVDDHITPISEKTRILEEMGVDYVLVLTFDRTFLNLSAAAFIEDYLVKMKACYVSVGFDFRFGQGGAGTPALLLSHRGFHVNVSESVVMADAKVSTRGIKADLKMGNLDAVHQMLGRPFSISGEVIHGRHLGNTIGFPTANLKLDPGYFFPLRGVYATRSHIDGTSFKSMTNIGMNPTVNTGEMISIETYIIDFEADIYGENLRIEFLDKIRDEIKFSTVDALMIQLEKDKKRVQEMTI